ncbi:hypothetical protein [Hymenobacter lucidus]|uniref:Type II secretion system protein GspC N-terminal domain-containing protein n=1 Tax=Hymenobacter lucidus TaxID=2880930 RepID=A0ABS8AZC2_9BACT|nr:hypothetical protein [Hymenobacter lucidus]MCB2411160.1 hypothetical protein [Hymenobacter lucidus]
MKNKRFLYLLVPAVMLIWGLIGYRIWQAVNADTELLIPSVPRRLRPAAGPTVAKQYTLSLAYSDPFRTSAVPARPSTGPRENPEQQTRRVNMMPSTAPKQTTQMPLGPVAVSVPMPVVEFLGTIENRQSRKRIVLLNINGRQASLSEHQSEQGLQIVRVFKDSVWTTYGRQHHTYSGYNRETNQ